MKIADTSFAPRFIPPSGRTAAGSADEIFGYDPAACEPQRLAVPEKGPVSRTLAGTLSEMHLDASEPSRSERAKASSKATEADFGQWAKMSIAEKIRAQILAQHNETEESLRDLPKEMRDTIEAEIQGAIKRQYGVGDQNDAGTAKAGASASTSST